MFWDLYCAAPERRDTCDHSSEAKAFHDYVSSYKFASIVCHCYTHFSVVTHYLCIIYARYLNLTLSVSAYFVLFSFFY